MVSKMFKNHWKFCVCGFFGIMHQEELQSIVRRMHSKEIVLSEVKRNAISIVTAGSNLIGTVEG